MTWMPFFLYMKYQQGWKEESMITYYEGFSFWQYLEGAIRSIACVLRNTYIHTKIIWQMGNEIKLIFCVN